MPGCLLCSNNVTCLTCDTSNNFLLSGASCVCEIGYSLAGSNCNPCNSTLFGCLACTSPTSCTSCDISAEFITNTGNPSVCACQPGFYQSGSVCINCSTTGNPGMASCQLCTDGVTCTQCDATQFFALSGTSCICIVGHYFNTGTSTCDQCSMPGCLACTDLLTCTQCDTTDFFSLSAGTCNCDPGYYPSGLLCVPCPIGCTLCDITGTSCTACDTASGFSLSGSSCNCNATSYLPTGLTACSPCTAGFSMCTQCTDVGGCTAC